MRALAVLVSYGIPGANISIAGLYYRVCHLCVIPNLNLDKVHEGITIPVTRMSSRLEYFCKDRVRVFNAIFNNISVIL